LPFLNKLALGLYAPILPGEPGKGERI
jgi:hypothetical protein